MVMVMVMVNVDLYSAIITKVSNALDTLVSGEKPGFQTLSKGLVVLLRSEVVRQRVPDKTRPDLTQHETRSAYDSVSMRLCVMRIARQSPTLTYFRDC